MVANKNPRNKLLFSPQSTNCTASLLGRSISVLPTMSVSIKAIEYNFYEASISLENLDFHKMALLCRCIDEVYLTDTNKFILCSIKCQSQTGMQLLFKGQVSTAIPHQAMTGNAMQIKLIPSFYLTPKRIRLIIHATPESPITNQMIKREIAARYGLALKSYSATDKNVVENDIDIYIDNPYSFLREQFPSETIYADDKTLYFFDRRQTEQSIVNLQSFTLNEKNGLCFIKQINGYVYECSCLFLPNLSINSYVTINPISAKNKSVLNGSITGNIISIVHSATFSFQEENEGLTTFQVLVRR